MNFQSILSFIVILSFSVLQAQILSIDDNQFDKYLGKNISTFTPVNNLTINEITNSTNEFELHSSDVPNLGITKKHHWAKFSITNNSNFETLFLQSDFTSNTVFDVYLESSNEIVLVGKYGKQDIDYSLQQSANLLTIPFNLPKGETATFYIKVYSYLGVVFPLRIQNTTTLIKSFFRSSIFGGIFLGAIFIMLIYNLFLYFQLQNKNYLFYSFYVLGIILYLSSFKGYLPYFLDLNKTIATNLTFYLCIYTLFTGAMFGYNFLSEAGHLKWFKFSYHTIQLTCIITVFIYLLSPQTGFTLFYLTAIAVVFYLTFYALFMIKKGYQPAKYYVSAQFIMLLALLLSILRVFNFVPFTFITFHLTEIGTLLDVTIFSVALASHIKIIIEEKEKSKTEAYANELKYLESVKNHQKRLEEEVEKQTLELHIANKELQRQALGSQINPHFIFNVLNSIQSYLLNEKYDEAETYLAKFSKLIRFYLTSTSKKFIPLAEELDAIHSYLDIEKSRTNDSFNYKVLISEDINKYAIEIPSLIILPFLENAVWHGIVNKGTKGNITIQIMKIDCVFDISIIDDGVGINKTKSNPAKSDKNSLGIKITKQKIQLLNEIYNSNHAFSIIDLSTITDGADTGTEVNFTVPFQNR